MKIQSKMGDVKITMLKGEQGEKGDTGSFEQLTKEQQDEIIEYVGARTLHASIESHTGTYTTTGNLTSSITIPIASYSEGDILFVFVEGLALIEDVDYTVSGNMLTLSRPITHEGTVVHFKSIRATW